MMHKYQHNFEPSHFMEAVQLHRSNINDVARWCGGRDLETTVLALEVPVQGGASSVIANEGDYILVDTKHNFHVRSAQLFEQGYHRAHEEDEPLEFDEGVEEPVDENDYEWSTEAAGSIPGETEDEDRL